jgi:hypothetical protein
MNRRADLCADPAFNAAVLAVRRAGTDADTLDADARLIALAALSAFAKAGGLTDPGIGRLMRYASDSAQCLSNASGQPVS